MFKRTIYLIGAASLLASPVAAQFGVPKKGSTFQEIQEQAKQEMQGMGDLDLDALANMDIGEMQKMIQNAMNDPAMMDAMGAMNQGVEDAMEQLAGMDANALQKQMMEGLEMLTGGDIMDSVMQQKDAVLETLAQQGLVDASKLEEYRNDPELFEKEMKDAFGQMKDIFSNPDTLEAATQMMQGMSQLLSDPEKAMKELADTMSDALGDDDKIEEARLQLLSDPEKAGNPLLADMFKGEEMQDILHDPIKWREQVKKGQGMLLGGDDNGRQGAGVGEL